MSNKTAMSILNFSEKFQGVELSRFNPHFKNKYASWDDIWSAAKPILLELGIASYFTMSDGKITLHVSTEDGETLSSSLELKAPDTKNFAQAVGSTITYFKRYLFAAMFNICEQEDDDGNAADVPKPVPSTEHQHSQILDLQAALELSNADLKKGLKSSYQADVISKLDVRQATNLIDRLNKKLKEKNAA